MGQYSHQVFILFYFLIRFLNFISFQTYIPTTGSHDFFTSGNNSVIG